jgi:hypothetical protein
MSGAILDGMQAEISAKGLDVSEMEAPTEKPAPKKRAPRKAKAETASAE